MRIAPYKTAAFIRLFLPAILLLAALRIQAEVLPILPFPQHVSEGKKIIKRFEQSRADFTALDKKMSSRLAFHAQELMRKQKRELPAVEFWLIQEGLKLPKWADAWKLKIGAEGYLLMLDNNRQIIAANTEAGLFYGLQSYKQLRRAGWNRELFVADWPTLKCRAIFDDISRGPISTVAFVKKQISRLAEVKINYLSFYIEHVVMPVSHPDFSPADGKFTMADIRELSDYATKFHMQLIGSFQSFGHFEKILSIPQYRSMGETSTLISPLDPKAKRFLSDVIGELCDVFSAPYFNVNCDETFGIADGRSKKYIDSIGVPKFYADHIKFLYNIVSSHKKQLMMWGDVALEHEEILDMLPKDIIYLTWEYGNQKSFDKWIKPFSSRNLRFMVCPGILNSYRMFPDMVMAKSNISGFINAGVGSAAEGAYTTIWDDGGTFLFSADWYGVYAAAEQSWHPSAQYMYDFDQRYEITAYAQKNGYTKALFKLLELRNLPLTFNLNDQLWNQKILPASGKSLILNNASAPLARNIVKEAKDLLGGTASELHQEDIDALIYSLDQYLLMIESRIIIADIVKNKPVDEVKQLDMLTNRYRTLAGTFEKLWLRENQNYWLDVALQPYREKITALQNLQHALKKTSAKDDETRKQSGLDLLINDNFYFTNWMLAGPFPLEEKGLLPAFLYSELKEYNSPPSPGNITQYQGKSYRWQKYASREGGVIDLDEYYKNSAQTAAYAYCSVTTTEAMRVTAFIGNAKGTEVFCNGEKLPATTSQSAESSLTLPLKAGVNHILIKLPQQSGSWMFTLRLDQSVRVANHKHKYTLNPKNLVHEVE